MSKNEVKFIDFTVKVKNAIDERSESALEEVSGDLESQVKRNTRVGSPGAPTKNSFKHKVSKTDEGFEATIGSDKENAIWEEFGTGSYALKGNGRKGYWVYVKGSDGKSSKTGKSYTLEEAKKVVAIMQSKGIDATYTNGKRPSRAFWNAYTTMKNKIITDIQNKFKGL